MRLRIALLGHGHVVLPGAYIDARGIRVELLVVLGQLLAPAEAMRIFS